MVEAGIIVKKSLSILLLLAVTIFVHLTVGCDLKVEQSPNSNRHDESKVINSSRALSEFIFKLFPGSKDVSSPLQSLVPFSQISWGYELNAEKWITFLVPVASETIKIVTNANLVGGSGNDPGAKWRYAFDWKILDKESNRIVKSGRYSYDRNNPF